MQVGQNVEALLVGIANGWRPMLSIRLAIPRPSEFAENAKPAPSGGFDAREERDLRDELGDMPQVTAGSLRASSLSRLGRPAFFGHGRLWKGQGICMTAHNVNFQAASHGDNHAYFDWQGGADARRVCAGRQLVRPP